MLLNANMMNTILPYIDSQVLWEHTLRMSKDFTSFFYFTMEANENIAFYSTLPFEKGQAFRDIVVYVTPELNDTFLKILNHCQKRSEIEILSQKQVEDS